MKLGQTVYFKGQEATIIKDSHLEKGLKHLEQWVGIVIKSTGEYRFINIKYLKIKNDSRSKT